MKKYVIMGVQGCGKGTQAKLLAAEFDLVHISVGDIFRWNIQNHTKLAARVNRLVAAGNLVSDDIVEEIVQHRLREHDWNFGFILDGFPRNRKQAEFFLESFDIDAVINIELPDLVVEKRVMARRRCPYCGLDYNLIYHRPKDPCCCDVCGHELEIRADDTREALQKRLADFHEKTQPVLDLFARKELVVTVDGSAAVQEVRQDIWRQLGLEDSSK